VHLRKFGRIFKRYGTNLQRIKRFMEIDNAVCEGEKVYLLPFTLNDITTEYVSWLNDPEVVKYSNQRFKIHSISSCLSYLASFDRTSNFFLKIVRKGSGQFIGTMTAYVSTQHQTVDIGIMIGLRSVWGNGLGQDAWNALIKWFIQQSTIRKITAGTMQSNTGMINLIVRSGMVFEARRKRQELLNGVPEDLLYFGLFCEKYPF